MRIVHLHTWKSWLTASGKEDFDVEWRSDLTLRDLVPHHMRDVEGLRVFLNREQCFNLNERPCVGDHVDIAILPGDPASAAGAAALSDAVLTDLLLSTAAGVLAILAINQILVKLIGRPKGPKERGDEQSPNSAWSGSSNVRVEGQPRPVGYGRFRVAPTIIDEFIVTRSSPPTSTLYTLGAIAEGPVYRIGNQLIDTPVDTPLSSEDADNPIPTGIQVNGNNLENFRNVECHVRMGNDTQDPVPGFEVIATEHEIGATLTQTETTATTGHLLLNDNLNLTTVPYNSNDPDAQAVWDAFGFSFDMLTPADQFTSLITFPRGLFRVTSTGDIDDGGFQALMRYKELDSDGVSIDSGGDNGDGWVYVQPEPMLRARNQQQFGREYSGSFMDPQNFDPGELGRACFFDGTNDYATTNLGANDTIQNAPATWAAGQSPDEMTITGWFQFDNIPGTGGSTVRPLIEISDPASSLRGVELALVRMVYNTGSGGTSTRWVPGVYTGNGSGVTLNVDPGPYVFHFIPANTGVTAFHHIAFTYKKLAGSNSRVTIYLDGTAVYTKTASTVRIVAAGKALEMARSRTFQATNYSKVRIDEVKVYDRELSAADMAADYAGGVGLYGSASDNLVAGWHFEGPTVTTSDDYGEYNGLINLNDLNLLNGAGNGGIGTGWVITPGSGPIKRSRYRVEMLRLNLKSSNTFVQDESVWTLLYGKIPVVLSYPNLALIGTKIQANEQLSGSAPKLTSLCDLAPCPVWDGVSSSNPNIVYQWTRNPAWICLDIATNKRYGRGAEYDFLSVDLPSVKAWADYCDEFITDNRGEDQGIHETDDTMPVFDLRYDSTMFDSFGGIEIHFRTSPSVVSPPRRWVEGRSVGFSGLPAPAGSYTFDLTSVGGFEIGSVTYSTNWRVNIKYDTLTYGAPWTDGQFLSAVLGATLAGTVEGRERRFEYSWIHDTFKSFWDTLVDVAATARAVPLREGKRLRFKVEKPRTSVGLIGKGQMTPGTFQINYTGVARRTNSIQADFWDEDKNYDRKTTSMDDPELDPSTPEEDINRESITVEGITRRSQMKRHLYFMLLVSRLLGRSGKFNAGLDILPYEVGDVFQIAHDIVPWGTSGRLGTGSSTTALKLDRTLILQPATTYYAKVRTTGQVEAVDGTITDRYETVQVTQAAGTYAAGTSISIDPLSFTPAKDDPYVVYTTEEMRLVQITSDKITEGTNREIEFIEYNEDVHDCDVLPEPLTV